MPEKKTIDAVLREHTDNLMSIPGVVGVAQGESEGAPCVMVLVARQSPSLLERLPHTLDGYRVTVHKTGDIRAL